MNFFWIGFWFMAGAIVFSAIALTFIVFLAWSIAARKDDENE